MKQFCLMCFNLNQTSISQEEGGKVCYGYCKVKGIYKYSPYHNCAEAKMGTNPEGHLRWYKNMARGLAAAAARMEEEMPLLTSERRSPE